MMLMFLSGTSEPTPAKTLSPYLKSSVCVTVLVLHFVLLHICMCHLCVRPVPDVACGLTVEAGWWDVTGSRRPENDPGKCWCALSVSASGFLSAQFKENKKQLSRYHCYVTPKNAQIWAICFQIKWIFIHSSGSFHDWRVKTCCNYT